MAAYRTRVVDAQLTELLHAGGAIVLEGARACGKSATGRHHSQSQVQFDVDPEALALAEVLPQRLLDGDTPRFLDEWQLAPQVWNQVRAES